MTTTLVIVKKIRNSLNLALGEAFSSAAVQGFGNVNGITGSQYIVAYALAMKATVSEISLIMSLPVLMASLAQLHSAGLIKMLGNRKRVSVIVGLFSIFMWLPFIFIPFIFHSNQVWGLLIFYILITLFWTLDDPAWESLLSDLVPHRRRGKFLGRRKLLGGITLLATSFAAGLILNSFQEKIFLGFFIIFSLAMFARAVSWFFVTRIYEPPMEFSHEERFGFLEFIKNIGRNRIGKVILLSALMNLSINMAAPFYAVYMLREMKLDMMTFVLINLVAAGSNLFTLSFWGKRIDSSSALRVISFTSIGMAFPPLLWSIWQGIPYLIIVQIFYGMIAAGFNLSIPIYISNLSEPGKRPYYLSYLFALNMGMAGIGAILSGFLIEKILKPQLLSSEFLDLFLISGVLSMLVAVSFFFFLEEAPSFNKNYLHKPKVGVSTLTLRRSGMKAGLYYNIPLLPVLAAAGEKVRVSNVWPDFTQRKPVDMERTFPRLRRGLYYNLSEMNMKRASDIELEAASPGEKKAKKGLYYLITK